MGNMVNSNLGSQYSRSCRHNGWDCSFSFLLCCHALVEDTVAKLKYAHYLYIFYEVVFVQTVPFEKLY